MVGWTNEWMDGWVEIFCLSLLLCVFECGVCLLLVTILRTRNISIAFSISSCHFKFSNLFKSKNTAAKEIFLFGFVCLLWSKLVEGSLGLLCSLVQQIGLMVVGWMVNRFSKLCQSERFFQQPSEQSRVSCEQLIIQRVRSHYNFRS